MKYSGILRQHHSKLSTVYRALDILIIGFSLLVTCWYFNIPWNDQYSSAVLLASALMIIVSYRHDLYRSWRVFGIRREIVELLTVWSIVVVSLLAIAFVFKTTEDYSRIATGTWFIFTPLLMSVLRIIVRKISQSMRKKGWNTRSVAIVGANSQGMNFAQTIKNANWMGLKLIGFFDDRSDDRIVEDVDNQVLGNLDDVVRRAKSGELDLIYITMPLKAEDRTRELIQRLSDTTVSLYYVPDFYALDILYGRWQTLGDSQVVSVYETPYHGVNDWIKRIEDISIASIVLAVIALPMLIISLGVKLSSPGPIIFKQRRYGVNGQEIQVWKFRSMTVCEDKNNVQQATKRDVRITPFGAFLRRTSLDELPQFINVLQGHMSIVGPRPHAVAHNEEYRIMINRYMMRHKVKPGITGWAQVNGWRGETDTVEKMEKRIEFDLDYIRHWSIWLDLKIFVMTFFKGFIHKNAY